jgi:hypothetical protein
MRPLKYGKNVVNTIKKSVTIGTLTARKAIFFYVVLSLGSAGVFAAEPAKPSDLARVGIVKFINNTGSSDFEWVEQSLPDAIDTSMKARFEYERLTQEKVQAAAAKVPPGRLGYNREDAAKISTLAQADILIFGNFYPDTEAEELVLNAVIYNAAGNKLIGRVENRTPLNAKIFKNIDVMASQIVTEIYKFALQSDQDSTVAAKKKLKLLVLVPSFATSEDEEVAKAELVKLKDELSSTNPGRYLTIYEFFDEYHVVEAEQQVVLTHASQRARQPLQLWLERYGVTNAMIVLVSDNKVNITNIAAHKTAQVSYAVNASPEERARQLAAAQENVSEKLELKKDRGSSDARFALHMGPLMSKGFLSSGDRLGLLAGVNIHTSMRLWRFIEPHIQLEAYYGFQKGNVSRLVGGSALGGFGYTMGNARIAIAPYIVGGIFTAQITAAAGIFNVLLPSAGGGVLVSYYVSPHWGFTLSGHAQYVIDTTNPALFTGVTLATVVRF